MSSKPRLYPWLGIMLRPRCPLCAIAKRQCQIKFPAHEPTNSITNRRWIDIDIACEGGREGSGKSGRWGGEERPRRQWVHRWSPGREPKLCRLQGLGAVGWLSTLPVLGAGCAQGRDVTVGAQTRSIAGSSVPLYQWPRSRGRPIWSGGEAMCHWARGSGAVGAGEGGQCTTSVQ